MCFTLRFVDPGPMFEDILRSNIKVHECPCQALVRTPSSSSMTLSANSVDRLYLRDIFSTLRMKHSEIKNFRKEALQEQFETPRSLTTTSPVTHKASLVSAARKYRFPRRSSEKKACCCSCSIEVVFQFSQEQDRAG